MPGPITSLSLTDSGFGYIVAPTITISVPDLDSGTATATTTIDVNKRVTGINLVDSGAYYVNIPTVTIDPPNTGIVTAASIAATGIGHINGQNYNTTGGSGTGLIIRALSSGGLTNFSIISGGKNYVVGDQVLTDDSTVEATIDIDSVGSGIIATAVATLDSDAGGRVTSLSIVLSGSEYDSAPSVTINSADGTAADFRATAEATINDSGRINSLSITDSGSGYITAPAVTIDKVHSLATAIEKGDPVSQTLSSGVKIFGELVKYSDSDGKAFIAHVGADDGLYHTFVTGREITLGPTGNQYNREIISVTEDNKISENEKNELFDTTETDMGFLDFTESNPFGDPQ